MLSADQFECPVPHCLRIDTDPADSALFENLKLLRIDAVRPSRFHSELLQGGKVKILTDHPDQSPGLRGFQRCRSSAADIQGIQYFALHKRRRGLHFPLQGVEILIHPVLPGSERI